MKLKTDIKSNDDAYIYIYKKTDEKWLYIDNWKQVTTH